MVRVEGLATLRDLFGLRDSQATQRDAMLARARKACTDKAQLARLDDADGSQGRKFESRLGRSGRFPGFQLLIHPMSANRKLRLGTRRSALAWVQSSQVAAALRAAHPGLEVELVGIETRGDAVLDRPLSAMDGKEFFTAEIDVALREGRVDFTVHSLKDLSLERPPEFVLAAVPKRANPRDIALFAPDVPQRLAAAQGLRIGTSSPRRAELLPPLLCAGPAPCGARQRITLENLRGNVDSRLRRLHEPRGTERHLDGVVLATAGLSRLFADTATERQGQQLLTGLLQGLHLMVLPLTDSPGRRARVRWPSSAAPTMRDARIARGTRRPAHARRHHRRTRAAGRTWRWLPPALRRRAAVAAGPRRPAARGRPQCAPCTTSPSDASCRTHHCRTHAGAVRAWDGSAAEDAQPRAQARCRRSWPRSCAQWRRVRRALPCAAARRRAPRWPARPCGPRARRAGLRWPRRACGCRAAAKAWARRPPRELVAEPLLRLPPLHNGMCLRTQRPWTPGRPAAGPAPM